jgi:cellulose synthase/poly-beta-1,6-N-acetylglucosamine synthase-like glycosyltransferase
MTSRLSFIVPMDRVFESLGMMTHAQTTLAISMAAWLCLIPYLAFCLGGLIVQARCRFPRRFPDNVSDSPVDEVVACRPLVSVLIPAFNEERVIEATVRAVLSSDYRHIEVVVVDDGSSDLTAQIVSQAFAQEKRVRVVVQPSNMGKAEALNAAVAVAGGEYVVVIDADTIPARDFVGRMMERLLQQDVDAVAGNVRAAGRRGLSGACQAIEYVLFHATRLWQGLSGSITTIAGAAGAMRREALLAIGGYSSETKAEDADLTLRLRQHGFRVAYLPDAIVYTETPSTWRALFNQRVRWCFGNLQCIGRQLRRTNGPAGFRLSGLPIFVYENMIQPVVEFGRACIPVVVMLGWARWPVALLCAYAALLLLTWSTVVFSFRLEGERSPRLFAIAIRYALWPVFAICPYVVAVWKLMTLQSIRWGKAERKGILVSDAPRAAVITGTQATGEHSAPETLATPAALQSG